MTRAIAAALAAGDEGRRGHSDENCILASECKSASEMPNLFEELSGIPCQWWKVPVGMTLDCLEAVNLLLSRLRLR